MKHIVFLMQCAATLGLVSTSTASYADQPRSPSVTCNGGGLAAPPKFGRAPPGVAEYSFSAWCVTRAGQNLGYLATGTWTPSETNPANANASEIYRIRHLSGPTQSYDVILGARCDSDPWLNPRANCRRIGDNLPDELRTIWPDLITDLFPYSRRAIPYGEQDGLRAQYNAINRNADTMSADRAYAEVPAATRASSNDMSITSDLVAHAQPLNTVRVQIRYPVTYGYRDASGLFDASPNSCGAYRIEAVPISQVPGRPLIGILTQPRMGMSNGMYVCEYVVSDLPLGEPVSLRVTMSDQGAAASQAWAVASEQPSPGQRRTILNGNRQVMLTQDRPRLLEVFDMAYSGATNLPETVRAMGRVKLPGASTAPARPICDVAREARARNSPAAAGLEGQCRAQQNQAQQTPLPDLDALAAKGPAIAMQDPLADALRSQQPDSAVRGFDIGMAAAEGQTGPGPGKQRIHDALPAGQQAGFATAVAFSLERNRYADRAAKGAAIALADPIVATARDAESDVFYRLGFDIATAIFGDPTLGAQGNTATGPGSLGIRDSLSDAGQRGFNAATSLHLSRAYGR